MDYEGKGSQQNSFTYTYTTPGTFKLSVLYQSIGADDIVVTVVPNIQPAFELYTCSSNRVSLKVSDKNYEQYFINLGDGTPVVGIPSSNNQIASHTYAAAGNYNISIHGKNLNAADNCSALTQPFTALAVLPTPTLNTLTALDPSRLRLDFSAAPHLQLHLEIAVNNSNTFQLFKTLYGVSSDTVSNIKLDDNYYCFRLSAYDPCTGGNNYSNTVCSQKFAVTPQSDVNQLAWITSATGVADYSIARNKAPYATTPSPSYSDANIICKTNYCYRITTNYGNGSKSISLEKCADAFSSKSPTPVNDASAMVSASQVALSWLQDPQFSTSLYSVYRSQNSGSFQLLSTSGNPAYTDGSYTTDARFCYQVIYADQCGNYSPPGAVICPLRLAGSLDKRNVVTLSWSGYTGWKNGVKSYSLEKFDQQGNLLKTFFQGTDTTFVDNEIDLINQIVSYKITATPNDPGLANSVSNVVRFIKGVNLFYPTAFTPNGDSLNDGFTVSGHYIAKMQLNIFDRWGTLIFSTDSNEPWDGTYNGRLMPEMTYVWTAKVTDIAARNFTHTGTIVLLNKNK
jgi:gliding motility-associated-like protein